MPRRPNSRRKPETVLPNPNFLKGNSLSDFPNLGVEVRLKPRAPSPASGRKTIQNVSLQAWAVPTEDGVITLVPGASVEIPATAITERLINLKKRRLVNIR